MAYIMKGRCKKMNKKYKKLLPIAAALALSIAGFPARQTHAETTLGSKLLVGYWQNFRNQAAVQKLRDVPAAWNVIDVAFGETGSDQCTVQFTPDSSVESDSDFSADVKTLQSKGKKVLLSLGGQNGVVRLPDSTSTQNFVNSLEKIIDKYGFNGIDIDLENGMVLNSGDTNFKNPTTPQLVNLISAVKALCSHYGSSFMVTMAPETAYVQGGYNAYGGSWGAYLPVIYGLKDNLTFIHVQHYNAGSGTGLDGKNYSQGTADYEVAMAEMLLHGFPIANNPNNTFPALRQDQVMIGLPACSAAAPSGGYINPTEMKKALDYLIKGISYGGTYKLVNATGYPNFRGLMAWSTNWDQTNNYEFTNNYRTYFDGIQPPPVTIPGVPTGLSATVKGTSEIDITWNSVSGATSYDIIIDGNIKTNVSSPYLHAGLSAESTHTYQVRAVNSVGASSWSSLISAKTNSISNIQPWAPNTTYKAGDLVTYNGITYMCRQPHTSLVGWEPPAVAALWQPI